MRERPWHLRLLTVALALAVAGAGRASAQGLTDPDLPLHVAGDRDRTDVLGAIRDSMKLLLIEHGTRIGLQEKTRRELAGPFWRDYKRSVRWPTGWEDTDGWAINYIGHPLHGAAAGQIWLDHGPDRTAFAPGERSYWSALGRATIFSTMYSLQFEIGPLSEASIGNVGMRPETTGWVDHVMTPAGAFGLILAEDALDRFVRPWVEDRVGNPVARALIRMALGPSKSMANFVQNRAPWQRADRPVDWR